MDQRYPMMLSLDRLGVYLLSYITISQNNDITGNVGLSHITIYCSSYSGCERFFFTDLRRITIHWLIAEFASNNFTLKHVYILKPQVAFPMFPVCKENPTAQ